MKSRLVLFSTVVVGDAHNPTVLNPDFLHSNNIVSEDWGFELRDTFTTPPLSIVNYKNNVSITVEPGKLQVADGSTDIDPTTSKVSDITTSYVTSLPHVKYTAVGTNFQSAIELAEPGPYLIERFLKSGPWNTGGRPLKTAGMRLMYALDDECRVTLRIDPGEAQGPDESESKPVILANGNFNRNCSDHPTHERVAEFMSLVSQDWITYQELLHDVVQDKG